MSIDFDRHYFDSIGTMYKCIGRAISFNPGGKDEILMAPLFAGSVGDVVYIAEEDFDEEFSALPF